AIPAGPRRQFYRHHRFPRAEGGGLLEETLGAKFETFEVEKLWDKAFVGSRPDIAAALKGAAIDKKFYEEHRNKVIEYIAEHDDVLVDKYLNGETLTLEEMRKSIRKSTLALNIVPVLAGSALKNKGLQPFLARGSAHF